MTHSATDTAGIQDFYASARIDQDRVSSHGAAIDAERTLISMCSQAGLQMQLGRAHPDIKLGIDKLECAARTNTHAFEIGADLAGSQVRIDVRRSFEIRIVTRQSANRGGRTCADTVAASVAGLSEFGF